MGMLHELHVNSAHHQIPRDNTSVDIIDLTKIPVRLYGLKALYRNTEILSIFYGLSKIGDCCILVVL